MPGKATADQAREMRAIEARLRQLKGQSLSAKQRADLQWLDRLLAARHVDAWARNCSKADYCRLAGRQNKLVDDAARQYALPIGGPTIDLYAAVKALHDFLAANGPRLRSIEDADREELEKEKLRKQIEGYECDNEKKQIELQHARGEAIPKADLRAARWPCRHNYALGRYRRSHPAAVDDFNECLDRLAEEIDSGKLHF